MNMKTLIEAREYEKQALNKENKSKAGFHVTVPVGWLNDPNGFSIYQDEYHLFFQYYPYATSWGPMHWGHCTTKDFVKWKYLPAAMAPDQSYDKDGCFSGSAVSVEDKHVLIYTGVVSEFQENGVEEVKQTQCIAIGNGMDYKKYEGNPVVTPELVTEKISTADFRDPKVWKCGNLFYMVVGGCNEQKYGRILLFSSANLKEWKYEGIIAKNDGSLGRMWECPDFFEIDDEYILIVSPQDIKSKDYEFHNGNCTAYFKGKFNYDKCIFEHESPHMIDYGLDFYAPQTTKAKDGRRILIGWMQSWDNKLIPESYSWNGMMTLPRELTIKNGKLIQKPIRELENYYKDEVKYTNIKLSGKKQLKDIYGRQLNLEIEITGGSYRTFEVQFAKSQEYSVSFKYDPKTELFTFNRSNSNIRRDVLCERTMKVGNLSSKIKIRLILDLNSAEIFINDGEKVMTSVFITPEEAKEIEFIVEGKITANITKNTISI